MREIECRKGFTIVELCIVLAIIAIIAVAIMPGICKGAGPVKTLAVESTEANIKNIVIQLEANPSLYVEVVCYRANWTNADLVDESLGEAKDIINKIKDKGISLKRIIIGMANAGTQFTDNNPHVEKDGIYLQLTY